METTTAVVAVGLTTSLAVGLSFAQFTNEAITTNPLDQSEPSVAISPVNPNNLLAVWNHFQLFGGLQRSTPGYAFSNDGGQTWNASVLKEVLNEDTVAIRGFDPSAGFDDDGSAFYGYVNDGTYDRTYVSTTTTFQPPFTWQHVRVGAADGAEIHEDKPFIAVDNNASQTRVHATWVEIVDTNPFDNDIDTRKPTTGSLHQS